MDITDYVIVVLDPGTSLTKIIYRNLEGRTFLQPKLLTMDSTIAQVPFESIKLYEASRVRVTLPENESWIYREDNYYAVGHLAVNYFKGFVNLKQLKYEVAVIKVLAAVGAIASHLDFPMQFSLGLAVPLPYSEWEDREKFEEEVTSALSEFIYRGRKYQVYVNRFLCVPEGAGHTMTRMESLGKDFDSKKIISVMIGYRDISVIKFDKGIIKGETEKLGMVEMITLIQKKTSGQDAQRLLSAIHQAGKKITAAKFEYLTLSKKQKNKEEEAKQIALSVSLAKQEYWLRIKQWLTMILDEDADEIIVGGGTADYLRSEIKTFLSKNYSKAEVFWAANLERDIEILFNLNKKDDSLPMRLTDAYGLLRFFQRQIIPNLSEIIKSG